MYNKRVRIATEADLTQLEPLYVGAIQRAFEVGGYIDWDAATIGQTIGNYVAAKEMYVFDESVQAPDNDNELYIAGAVRLHTEADPQIWNDKLPAAYFGKAATLRTPRRPGYFQGHMLQEMIAWAQSQKCDRLRADCIDTGLLRFYTRCGFANLGPKAIVENGKQLTVTLLEMNI